MTESQKQPMVDQEQFELPAATLQDLHDCAYALMDAGHSLGDAYDIAKCVLGISSNN